MTFLNIVGCLKNWRKPADYGPHLENSAVWLWEVPVLCVTLLVTTYLSLYQHWCCSWGAQKMPEHCEADENGQWCGMGTENRRVMDATLIIVQQHNQWRIISLLPHKEMISSEMGVGLINVKRNKYWFLLMIEDSDDLGAVYFCVALLQRDAPDAHWV